MKQFSFARRRFVRFAMVLVVAVAALCGPVASYAWFDTGHKIIASICWRRLKPEQQKALVDILKQHPRFQEDFKSKMPADLAPENEGEWIVQQAAVWPDLCRDFQGADREKYHHGPWHYLDIPLFLTEADRAAMEDKLTMNRDKVPPATIADVNKLNAIQAIAKSKATAFDVNAPASERALALCWLFHVVGDIHQPCHSTAMFSQKLFPNLGEGDRGGNLVKTIQRGNLHALWDGFPGSRDKWDVCSQKGIKILADAELTKAGEAAATKLDSWDWLLESHVVAKEYVYDAELLTFLKSLESSGAPPDSMACKMSEDYLKRGGTVSEKRVTEAGYRMGAILGSLK